MVGAASHPSSRVPRPGACELAPDSQVSAPLPEVTLDVAGRSREEEGRRILCTTHLLTALFPACDEKNLGPRPLASASAMAREPS